MESFNELKREYFKIQRIQANKDAAKFARQVCDGIVLCFAVFLCLLAMALSGCASMAVDDVRSITDAGVTSVDIGPTTADDDEQNLGTRYQAVFGKEYGRFRLQMEFSDDGKPDNLEVTATEVGAFAGQARAAEAVARIQQALSELGVTVTTEVTNAITGGIQTLIVPDEP